MFKSKEKQNEKHLNGAYSSKGKMFFLASGILKRRKDFMA